MVTSKALIRICLMTSILGTPTIAQQPPKPSAEHEVLAADEGTWDATITSFMGGPDGEPTVSRGTEVNTLLAGGLWLVSEFEGDFGGVKFVGRGHFGYDPLRKKYVGTWIDSMSPAIYTSEGAFDKAGKVYTETMVGPDPTGKSTKMRLTTEVKDKDHLEFKMYAPGEGGKEFLAMEATYTRKK